MRRKRVLIGVATLVVTAGLALVLPMTAASAALQRSGLERHDGVRRRVGGRLQRTAVHRELVEPGPPAQPVLRPVPGVAGRRGLHRRHHPATAARPPTTHHRRPRRPPGLRQLPGLGRGPHLHRGHAGQANGGSAAQAIQIHTAHVGANWNRPRRRPCGGG